ncbi:glycosyltransferase family 4 protein [Leptodesmis sichuanensis]|uniref:glycosyltransferase family 4 protein n=1 Tax=Leptodesmis sichuanensis TaxID=2906798 RepID=UPI001F43DD7C|nr:glycosyltransferase family 1 protein [Leptodesmis sichuanensis]UIE37499.1 glycosyltransferase family 4 protein [Leptodesmis sichuanensis A121]
MHILIPALHRPSTPTGVCRHAANLAQCLAETDQVTKVTLIIGDWQKKYFEEAFQLSSPKINITTISIKNSSLARNFWFLFGLPRLAARLQPDIIHLSFPFPFVRQWFEAPVVTTIHDLYPYECPENFGYPQVWFNRWFLRQCVYQSTGLSCVSQTTLNSLQHYFPAIHARRPITVIYNYVDFSHVKPRIPEKIASEEDLRFILCVGQHRKNKNLDLLIHAYHTLRQNGILKSSTKLLIVGSPGPETETLLHQIQSLALQEQTLLLSSIDNNELCWLYKHCELFVIPSSTEGFCLPLVEALSLSPRVVCSNIPIFQEVGSANCAYFELGDKSVINLAEVMAATLEQPGAKHPSVEPRFSKASVAQQLLNFYASV